jgi:hypothetical protein
MAVIYSEPFKKTYKTSEKTKLVGVFETPDARSLTAEMKVWTGEFVNDTGAGTTANDDIIFLGRLPKNVTLRSAFWLHTNNLGADIIGNANVGLYNLDESVVGTGDQILSTAGIRVNENLDLYLDNDYNVAIKPVPSIANGSKAKVVIMYTEM